MATVKTLRSKADALLAEGDKKGGAEGRRLLRKCRYYRRLTIEAEARIRDAQGSS